MSGEELIARLEKLSGPDREAEIGMLPSLDTLRAAIEFLAKADGLTGLHKIRVGGHMLTSGQVAAEIKTAIEGYAVQSAADDEEEFCTCGAGHGSGEEHTDWCKWTALAPRLYPPILPPLPAASPREAELAEQLHYANGVADLAMKHRDIAEAALEEEQERCARSQHRATDECDVAVIEQRQIEQFIEAQKIVPEQLPAEIKVVQAGDTTLTTLWSQNRPIAHWIRQRTEFNCSVLTFAAAIRNPKTGSGG